MFTISNLFKTIIISSVIAMCWVFFESSTAFLRNAIILGNPEIGRLTAFLETLEYMDAWEFWFHLIKQWFLFFSMIFLGCAVLLSVVKPPNKKRNDVDGTGVPPIR